jgi:RHS repeat-associated protein
MRHGVSPRGTTAQMTDGYYRDSEAATSDNLLLCTYRWYDPATARWLTRDPIGYAGGSNLYGYVGGNPVGGVDPWGLKPGYWEQFTTKVNHGIFHTKRAWKSGTRAVCKGYEYATSTTIGRAAGGAVAAFGGVTAVLGLYNRWTDYWNAGEIAEQIHYGEAQSANEGALLCDERYMKQRQKAIRDASLRGLLFGVDFMREEYNNLPTGPTRLR